MYGLADNSSSIFSSIRGISGTGIFIATTVNIIHEMQLGILIKMMTYPSYYTVTFYALADIGHHQAWQHLPSFPIFFTILNIEQLLQHLQTFILKKYVHSCCDGRGNEHCCLTRWKGYYRLCGMMQAYMQHFTYTDMEDLVSKTNAGLQI